MSEVLYEKYSQEHLPERTRRIGSSVMRDAQYRQKPNKLYDDVSKDEFVLKRYLSEIGQHELLTVEDEARLSACIIAGNEAAERLSLLSDDDEEREELQKLIQEAEIASGEFLNANLRLVIPYARNRAHASGMPILDLIQEGNLGLMIAVRKFDYRLGFKFSTYATYWIRQSITRGGDDQQRNIRISARAWELIKRLSAFQRMFEQEHGKIATIEELALLSGFTIEKVSEILLLKDTLSLDERIGEDSSMTRGDLVSDASSDVEKSIVDKIQGQEIATLLEKLPGRSADVLKLRFGLEGNEPHTLEQVGQIFGLTRERVRQIESRALAIIRETSLRNDFEQLR